LATYICQGQSSFAVFGHATSGGRTATPTGAFDFQFQHWFHSNQMPKTQQRIEESTSLRIVSPHVTADIITIILLIFNIYEKLYTQLYKQQILTAIILKTTLLRTTRKPHLTCNLLHCTNIQH